MKKSLEPVFQNNADVLILGSMPGEESLRKQEYYGYPRNQFWRLMVDITGFPMPESYGERLSALTRTGIALWDVIGSCLRSGSLDTNIKGEKPNELLNFIDGFDSLRAVFFNGQKSARSFNRSFGFKSLEERRIEYRIIPSSSPAHTMSYENKYSSWCEIKTFLRPFS